MRTFVTRLACFATVVGCSSQSTPASGPCATPSGSYLIHYVTLTGNCGAFADVVIVAADQSTSPAGCTGGTSVSTDGCAKTIDLTCPGDPGYTLTVVGKVTSNPDASYEHGVLSFTGRQGSTTDCSGTYDVSYTRQ